jgi:hypothetical protein
MGLLNGRYRVSCPYVEENFIEYQDRLNLIATLDRNTLWLNFHFGIVTGMMRVQRPYEANMDHPLTVFWRGKALPMMTNEYEHFNLHGRSRRLFEW